MAAAGFATHPTRSRGSRRRAPVAWPASRWLVLDLAENRPCRNCTSDFGIQPSDRARFAGVQGLFHLHRLEDDDQFARLRRSWPSSDSDLHDRAPASVRSRVADAARRRTSCARLVGRLPPLAAAAPTDRAAGSVTSMRLPPTSTVTACRSPSPSSASTPVVRRDLVVETGLDPARAR